MCHGDSLISISFPANYGNRMGERTCVECCDACAEVTVVEQNSLVSGIQATEPGVSVPSLTAR